MGRTIYWLTAILCRYYWYPIHLSIYTMCYTSDRLKQHACHIVCLIFTNLPSIVRSDEYETICKTLSLIT